MATWLLITVTKPLAARCGELRCRRCGRRLEVGELVWSHRITTESARKRATTVRGTSGGYGSEESTGRVMNLP